MKKVMKKLAILMTLAMLVSIVPQGFVMGNQMFWGFDGTVDQPVTPVSHVVAWSVTNWNNNWGGSWNITATATSPSSVTATNISNGARVNVGDMVEFTFSWTGQPNWSYNWQTGAIWWDNLNTVWRFQSNNNVVQGAPRHHFIGNQTWSNARGTWVANWSSSWSWAGNWNPGWNNWNQAPLWRVRNSNTGAMIHGLGGSHSFTHRFQMPDEPIAVEAILDGNWNNWNHANGWFDQWGNWHPWATHVIGAGATDWWFTGQGGGATGGTTFIGGRPAGTPAPVTDPAPAPAPIAPAPVVTQLEHPTLAQFGFAALRLSMGSTFYTHWGIGMELEAAPFVDEDNRAMVPLRLIAESLDAEVRWDGGIRTAFIYRGGLEVRLPIDVPLPDGLGTPVIVNNRTFVPLRYVSEVFGARVRWEENTNAVYVYRD